MKRTGLWILQASGLVLILSVATGLFSEDSLNLLGLSGEALKVVVFLALVGVVTGVCIYWPNRTPGKRGRLSPNLVRWFGMTLIALGIAPLAALTYLMLFVPTMGYLALAIVGFGPILLGIAGFGLYLILRANRNN